jgi:hypothetical protein
MAGRLRLVIRPTRPCFAYFGYPGDELWCREAWAHTAESNKQCRSRHEDALDGGETHGPYYRATTEEPSGLRWRSAGTMPRWASRLTFRLPGVELVSVSDITEDQAGLAGYSTVVTSDGFVECGRRKTTMANHWDTLYARRGMAWATDPWAWVALVERVRTKLPLENA